jgi:hypothetical protein
MEDRDTVGLTAESQVLLQEIEARNWFRDGQDIARFCLGFAVRAKVPGGLTSNTDTRWSAGNFDKTGEMRALLAVLYPEAAMPVRLMEHLVNEGLKLVAAKVRSDAIAPGDLFE